MVLVASQGSKDRSPALKGLFPPLQLQMGEDQPQSIPQKGPQTSAGSAGHEGCVASLAAGFYHKPP